MSDLHLLRPEWLWALVPLGFILLRVVRGSGGYSSWEKVVDRHLLEQLLQPAKQGRDH
ncbi:MAG: hypothetical protein GY814_15995, partial [Gammaproteobacteria bacterium]|nr:hypothetical protein [Gammaproteobacteria bacterium]